MFHMLGSPPLHISKICIWDILCWYPHHHTFLTYMVADMCVHCSPSPSKKSDQKPSVNHITLTRHQWHSVDTEWTWRDCKTNYWCNLSIMPYICKHQMLANFFNRNCCTTSSRKTHSIFWQKGNVTGLVFESGWISSVISLYAPWTVT